MRCSQMTLGGLVKALAKFSGDAEVRFAFGNQSPGRVMSYRGYYCELAIEPQSEVLAVRTVASLLEELRAAVGKTFTGYKGGDYVMSHETPLWAAAHGRAFQACIVDVTADSRDAVLETASAAACGR